jgi:hypothetical protein
VIQDWTRLQRGVCYILGLVCSTPGALNDLKRHSGTELYQQIRGKPWLGSARLKGADQVHHRPAARLRLITGRRGWRRVARLIPSSTRRFTRGSRLSHHIQVTTLPSLPGRPCRRNVPRQSRICPHHAPPPIPSNPRCRGGTNLRAATRPESRRTLASTGSRHARTCPLR